MATDAAASEVLAHRFHMELFNKGKLDVADEILAPEFVFHLPDQYYIRRSSYLLIGLAR